MYVRPKATRARLRYITRWRKAHPKNVQAATRRYYLRNKKKINQQAIIWWKNNREKHNLSHRLYYQRNAPAMRLRSLAWAKRNPDKVRRRSSRRRALEERRLHPGHNPDIELKLISMALRKTIATGVKHGVDHIIPLKRGGWHHHDNMQVMRNTLNSSKNANPLWEKKGYKSWRDVPEYLWPERLRSIYNRLK